MKTYPRPLRDDIAAMRKRIAEYHDEVSGTKLSRFNAAGTIVTYHMADYTAAAIDALSDLTFAMDMYEEHEREATRG